MNKKILLIAVILIILFGVGTFFDLYDFSNNQTTIVQEKDTKEVIITSFIDDVIFFDVPKGWNTFINGDPEHITDIDNDNFFDNRNSVYSVSAPDRPITHTDMNAEQIDFFITNEDIISDNIEDNDMWLEYRNFSGYVISGFDDSLPVSKGNSDGVVYYLFPKKESVNWNLIIRTQGSGDDEFQEGISLLLNSLRFQDHDEYINELNK